MEHALVERLDEMFRILVAIRRLGWYSRNLDEILSFGYDRSSRVDQHSDLVSPSNVLHSHEQQHPPLSAPNCHRGKEGPMNFTSYVPQEATRSRTPAVLLSACAPSPKGDGFGRRLKSAWSCRNSLFAYLETIVVLGHVTLKLYLLRYHLIRHIARRRHKVTTGPKVPTPELLADRPKVAHQTM